MKAIIIARVSTEEQKEAGLSLPAQLARLEQYCKSRSFKVIKTCSFDESAYKIDRDEFDRILDFILEQKEKVAVCCDKVDRLSRNMFDKRISTLYEKALNDEIELHFVSDGQILNSQISAAAKFQFGISLGLAKYYSDAISDNVKRSIEQKLRKGEWIGKAPFGYKNITRVDSKKDIVIDESIAPIIRNAFELYATGAFSMDLLHKKLKAEYHISWSKGYIEKLLNNHFYYGIMIVKGMQYPHRYTPLISKDLFDMVQDVKAGFHKKPYKYAGKNYIYRGLLRCAHCGLAITPEKHKGYVYYHCTQYNGKHGAKWLREEEITDQLGQVFKQLQFPEEILHQIICTLNEVHANKIEFHNAQFDVLTKKNKELTAMIDNLYLDKLRGRIDDAQYDRYYNSLRSQIDEVSSCLQRLQAAEDNYYITAQYLVELAHRAYDLFKSSEVEQKRQLIKLVLSNVRIDNEKVLYDAQKPFDVIIEYADHQRWRP